MNNIIYLSVVMLFLWSVSSSHGVHSRLGSGMTDLPFVTAKFLLIGSLSLIFSIFLIIYGFFAYPWYLPVIAIILFIIFGRKFFTEPSYQNPMYGVKISVQTGLLGIIITIVFNKKIFIMLWS